jgi:hypothetical protein
MATNPRGSSMTTNETPTPEPERANGGPVRDTGWTVSTECPRPAIMAMRGEHGPEVFATSTGRTPTPVPASGATVAALDLDDVEARSNAGSIWFGSRKEAIERLCKIADDDIPALVAEVRQSRETVAALHSALADIRDHGTRFDLNPTHRAGDEAFWHGYLLRIDRAIRDRARAALDGVQR